MATVELQTRGAPRTVMAKRKADSRTESVLRCSVSELCATGFPTRLRSGSRSESDLLTAQFDDETSPRHVQMRQTKDFLLFFPCV
jgi:hypothetical protein